MVANEGMKPATFGLVQEMLRHRLAVDGVELTCNGSVLEEMSTHLTQVAVCQKLLAHSEAGAIPLAAGVRL